ncbi:MAG: hypothetical protein AB7V58_12875 [Solirubrobacterales bacterium]
MSLQISQLTTTDGHLRDVDLEFSGGLNCIIGARGTCKSTIVETIRFLFDDDPKRVEQLLDQDDEEGGPSHRGLIAATLGGGTARLCLREGDSDTETVIERDTASRPTIYRDDVIVVEDEDLFRRIEIYSQGELQDLATDGGRRLALVDRPHQAEIDRCRKLIREKSAAVAAIGPRLRELSEAIEAAEASLAEGLSLRELQAQLRSQRPEMPSEVAELRAGHEARRARIATAEAALAGYRESFEEARSLAESLGADAERAAALRDCDEGELKEVAARLSAAAEAARALPDALADPEELDALLAAAERAAAEDDAPYYEAVREQEALTDRLKQEDRINEEVAKLDRIEASLRESLERREKLREDRGGLRAELRELRTRIFERRLAEVEDINTKFADRIVLALRQGTQSRKYAERLERLLEGSRLRQQADLCADLAAAFPPDALVDAIEAENSTTLAQTLDRDAGQMVRLVSHLAGSEEIFALEQEMLDDELDVTMYIEGRPRPVSEMSKGQQATAMLPLLLRSAPYPLILDQPEDDLDNSFVFNTLVERIGELKVERQLIFVTHNANIPVIGDAERVLALRMDGPDQAELIDAGRVEQMRGPIISLLEGGQDAFERRSRIYGLAAS